MEWSFLTVEHVAKILGVSEKSVRDFIASGELRAAKIGQWKVREEDLRDFIEQRSNRAVSARLENPGPQPVGTLNTCTIIDYYTTDPKPLTDELMNHINHQRPDQATFKWTYAWYPETNRARYTIWGSPRLTNQLLEIIQRFREAKS
ncbi:MAG: helix-turn-helix domain-containing protein [Bacillota bacterium]